MASVINRVSTASTTNAATYASGSFTPAANELLVVFVIATGDTGLGSLTDSQSLGFTLVTTAGKNSSADTLYCFIANKPAANSSMTVTYATNNGNITGAVVQVFGVSSMNRVGLGAVRQSSTANNVAAGTPATTFGAACLTGNPVLSFVANQTNPALTTGHPPTSWTQGTDTGYATPTTGAIAAFINSGFTGTTVTWGTSSATSYGAIVLELDTTTPAALSTLTDAFAGASLDTSKWTNTSFGGSVTESGGFLALAPGISNAGSGGQIISNVYYSLVGSYALFKITQIPLQNSEYSLILALDGNNLVRITGFAVDGHFEAVKVVNGTYTQLATATFNISTTNWWRIRESSGTIFWEYGSDGINWTTLFSVASPLNVSTVQVTLQVYDPSSDAAPGSLHLVDFNIPTATTTQTILGKARITVTTLQTILGKARITATTIQTILGKSRITATTTRTIQGISRITQTTLQTILGKSRIQSTTTKTIQGLSRITVTTLQTIIGKSRITATALQTILGKSRITVLTLQTILGLSRITKTTTQTIQGVSNIVASIVTTTQTILGKSRITALVLQTIIGKARVTATTLQTILGKADILNTTLQAIPGVARITQLVTKTITGLSRITVSTTKTILGVSRITVNTLRTILGVARIQAITTRIILGVANMVLQRNKTIQGLSRITATTKRTIKGKASITSNILPPQASIVFVDGHLALRIAKNQYISI